MFHGPLGNLNPDRCMAPGVFLGRPGLPRGTPGMPPALRFSQISAMNRGPGESRRGRIKTYLIPSAPSPGRSFTRNGLAAPCSLSPPSSSPTAPMSCDFTDPSRRRVRTRKSPSAGSASWRRAFGRTRSNGPGCTKNGGTTTPHPSSRRALPVGNSTLTPGKGLSLINFRGAAPQRCGLFSQLEFSLDQPHPWFVPILDCNVCEGYGEHQFE